MDFSQLPKREVEMLEKLSFFSVHRSMLKVLVNQYGESRAKERYIQDNISYLTPSEGVAFNKNQDFYKNRTFVAPAYIVGFSTVGSFLVALWRLPSRFSTVKYTLVGFTGGIVISYAFWKYSMLTYYEQLNKLLRIVTLERY